MESSSQVGLLLASLLTRMVEPKACMAGTPVLPEQIDYIFSALKSARTPGAAVLVLENGRVILERAYGVSDLRSFQKIDAHTNFRLASGYIGSMSIMSAQSSPSPSR